MNRPAHPELVSRSAILYREYLTSLRDDRRFHEATRAAAGDLVQMLDHALEAGPALDPADVTFTASSLHDVPADELPLLVNDWSVGLGRDDAPLIVMGTEAAYDPAQRWTLAIEGCGLTVMWLCQSNHEIASRVVNRPDWAIADGRRGPFHLYPNDYIRVQDWRSGNHTFKCVSKVAAWGSAIGNWRNLLEYATDHPRLGDLVYQIEVSAKPSARAAAGIAASDARLEFLRDAMATFRSSARALLFHGGTKDRIDDPRLTLAASFLGAPSVAWSRFDTDDLGIRSLSIGNHHVLFTRALNMAVSNRYLERVAGNLRSILSANGV